MEQTIPSVSNLWVPFSSLKGSLVHRRSQTLVLLRDTVFLNWPYPYVQEFKNLGVCLRSKASTCKYSLDELNSHLGSISFNNGAHSVDEFLHHLNSWPSANRFSFVKVILSNVAAAIKRSSSWAIGSDSIPQGIINAAIPVKVPIFSNFLISLLVLIRSLLDEKN